ncbi:hypothetical protein TCAL_02705 [Tigriopus californicus]|uniref:Chitin-binding type-2 domain-containing protein n=1 Tax=Tigriopus californicus TaxID=6832 RepID=A0A553PHC0_TIGCA|nr:hypothetical protein TCAL_02705 [Tigriopus californicus]
MFPWTKGGGTQPSASIRLILILISVLLLIEKEDYDDYYEEDADEGAESAHGALQRQVRFKSTFSCKNRHPGYYADMSLSCEVYHLCSRHGVGLAFNCPRGTRFQQRTMVCDHWFMVNCENSASFYDGNLRIGQPGVNFLDDDDPNVPVMQLMIKESTTRPPKRSRTTPQVSKSQTAPRQTRPKLLGSNRGNRKPKFMQVVVQDRFKPPGQKANVAQRGGVRHRHHEHHSLSVESRLNRGSENDQGGSVSEVFGPPLGENGIILDDKELLPFQNDQNRILRRTEEKKKTRQKYPAFPTKEELLQSYGIDASLKAPPVDATIALFKPRPTRSPGRGATSRQKPTAWQASPSPRVVTTPTPQLKFSPPPSPVASPLTGHVPEEHPLNELLPPTARVVAVKPLRTLALSNRGSDPSIMTLSQFLDQFPNISHVHTVPIQVKGAQVRMIEQLVEAQQTKGGMAEAIRGQVDDQSNTPRQQDSDGASSLLDFRSPGRESNTLDDELEDLIANRDARKVAEDNGQETDNAVTVHPRGGGAGPRFTQDLSDSVSPPTAIFPELEFGFQPLPRFSATTSTATTLQPTQLTTQIDEETKDDEDAAAAAEKDAFFFTTTKAPRVTVGGEELNELLDSRGKKKTSPFDMRGLFYIPSKPKVKPVKAKQLKPLSTSTQQRRRGGGGPGGGGGGARGRGRFQPTRAFGSFSAFQPFSPGSLVRGTLSNFFAP